eukprot:SAG31_NODE_946_length_10832_cov_105.950806_9_plen_60_part_00
MPLEKKGRMRRARLVPIGGVENIRKHRQAWFESRFKFAGADGRNLLFLIYVLYLVLYKS